MGGARGDAARRVMASSATTSNEKFADYIKFDDLFGASSIFTTGTPRQRQRERELYVKDVMERKLYGYVHRLETHGAPIERVAVGGGCEAPENAFGFAVEAPRANEARARASAPELADVRAKKKARMMSAVDLGHARGGAATTPRPSAPWFGRGSFSDFSAGRFPAAHDGSLANLFEHASGEDWEQDPLWAAMEEAVAGGVGGTLEDPSNLLPSALKPSAPPAPPVDFDGDFLPRARFELIEERINALEQELAATKAAARVSPTTHAGSHPGSRDASPPDAGHDAATRRAGPVDAFAPAHRDPLQRDLFVRTLHKDPAARPGGSGSDRGSGGKSPQSPSPKPWTLPDRSRSRSHSGEDAAEGGAGSGPGVGAGATATAGDPWATTAANRAYWSNRSTSFTSTPGPKTGEDGSGASRGRVKTRDAAERAAREMREHDLLRSELEHDKAQSALLRESNARYEARVAQLESAVRAAAEQTRELREALETARADARRRHREVGDERGRSGSAIEFEFEFERRRVDERDGSEPRKEKEKETGTETGVEREAFAAKELSARGGNAFARGGAEPPTTTAGAPGCEGNGVSPNVSGVEGGDSGAPGGAAEDAQGALRRLEGVAEGATERRA